MARPLRKHDGALRRARTDVCAESIRSWLMKNKRAARRETGGGAAALGDRI
jgi:hypothetical protein